MTMSMSMSMSTISKLCIQTDKTFYKDSPDAITTKNILELQTMIISSENNILLEDKIESLILEYKQSKPNIKLWFYDIPDKLQPIIQRPETIIDLVYITIYINGTYVFHHLCDVSGIQEKKQHILNNIKNNISKSNITMYSAHITIFDSNGKTKSSMYEQCSNWI